uniref:Selenium-binding protein 1 n=1 Tax=Romanomermis culicivorax TaxID=13658 RepID=A0A915K5I9_ROMCU
MIIIVKKKASSMDCSNSHCERENSDDASLKWDLMNFGDPWTAVKCSKKESIVYVSCINPRRDKPDYLAVVDVDDNSPTFCKVQAAFKSLHNYLDYVSKMCRNAPLVQPFQVVHRVHMPGLGDEVHHFGWNHCVGCRCDPNMKRSHLLMPSLHSNQIHVIDATKPKQPIYYKIGLLVAQTDLSLLNPCGRRKETIDLNEHNISFPHTVHCLPSGKIMVSFMGDGNDKAQGNFAVIDGETFEFEGKWSNENAPFGYDFWYKPNLNILISSSWGSPNVIKSGLFEKSDLGVKYGHYLYFWDYTTKKRIQTMDLGLDDGCMALEVRMCHDPQSSHGYVVTGVGGSIFHFWQESPERPALQEYTVI